MIGNNVLIVNEETIKDALQYYFDSLVFRVGSSQKIESISLDRVEGNKKYFKIEIKPNEKHPDSKDKENPLNDDIPF